MDAPPALVRTKAIQKWKLVEGDGKDCTVSCNCNVRVCQFLHEPERVGSNVRYATKSEAPSSCKELGEVSAGSFFALMTMESVKNDLRNQTSDLGGNFLVIDQISSVNTPTANGAIGSSGY